jgi:hypothetical protein
MPESPSEATLSRIDTEILGMLWSDYFRGPMEHDRVGLRISEIQDGLRSKNFVRSRSGLQRNHLNRLADRRLIAVRKAQTEARGDKPNLYTLNRDNIITWPSTACMVIEIWRAREVERPVFVKRMLDEQITNSATGRRSTEDAIVRQLDTSKEWGYLTYVGDAIILPARRTELELGYLRFVADQLAKSGV